MEMFRGKADKNNITNFKMIAFFVCESVAMERAQVE